MAIAIALVMCHFTTTAVGDESNQKKADKQNAANSTSSSDEYDPGESPQLGVIIGSCPGAAVCVLDTVWGSPADEAGNVHGEATMTVAASNLGAEILYFDQNFTTASRT